MKNGSSSASLAYFLVIFGLGMLSGCSDAGIKTDPTYGDREKEELYRYGSLASATGGFSFLGSDEKRKETAGPGVNAFLWRASLDTLSFMPIASVDPFGGVIATDWKASESVPNERLKLNVLILDRDLRADGVKVTVFRQVNKGKEGWVDAAAAPETGLELEKTILTRARQMWLAQKEKK